MHFCAWCTLYQDTQLQRVSLLHVICRKVRDHYDPPTATSASLVRAQQPPSHVAQGFLHSFPYPSPGSSTKPGRALSPYGLVAGGCTVLACWKGLGVGVLTEQHSGRPGNSSVSHQFTWNKSYPLAGSSQRKKEKKENCWIKSSVQMFFPVPSFAVAKMSKLWVQCTWEDQDKSLKGGMGEHPTALQCRQGLLRGLCLSRQSERTKVLISPSELILH